jgi:secreted trypsin-like serine protease
MENRVATVNTIWVALCVMGLAACGEQPDIELEQQLVQHWQGQPIINGMPASTLAKSIQGAILYESDSSWSVFCGSVYLGQNSQGQHWAATAAHCVDALWSSDRFGFGGLDLTDYSTSNTIGWAQAVQHPNWDSNNIINDIAVVRLNGEPANGTAVTLATTNTDAEAGETVTISGYGFDTQPSRRCLLSGRGCPAMPTELLEADTEVLSTSECQQAWDVTSTEICVEDPSSDQGACNGDSGGPMSRSNGTVVGLTSYGVSGCSPGSPQVYTRISAFRDWIASTTGI